MRSVTADASMSATSRIRPPHRGHASTSTPKARRIRSAHREPDPPATGAGAGSEARAPRAAAAFRANSTIQEVAMIVKSLRFHGGNISRVAESLGLSRAALYRRFEKYRISP